MSNSLVTIVLPVYNEEAVLAESVRKLTELLRSNFDYAHEITIANNGSTDRTLETARKLKAQYKGLSVLHLEEKGRGRAIKAAWSQGSAEILSYMDVDLSTDLTAFPTLIEPLVSGEYDLTIGSRLLQPKLTNRCFKRELLSRAYNFLVKAFFQKRFSDAQCGFKAITRTAAQELLPLVDDNSWFFDTELLVIAEKLGYRIFDLPVRWTENPDSRGKALVQNFHLLVPFHELKPVKSKSLTAKPSLHENLVIHGDNLKALKALLPYYHGRVKVIYIDPPYNTGNEGRVYNDNVSSPMMQEWLGKVVDREDLTRHDKWLCMMMPRLKLLREMLAPDGIIAISIDDNEVSNLGVLLDEIFPADNRLAIAPWKAEPSGGKQKKGLRVGHEYLLIYHNGDDSSVSREELSTGELDLEDELGKYRKGRELRKWGQGSLRTDRPDSWFELTAPDGGKVWPVRNDGKEGRWRWGKTGKMREAVVNPKLLHWEKCPYDEGVTVAGQTERWVPFEKVRDKRRSFGWSTWLDSFGFNSDGTREIKEIFGEKIFDTVKPTELLKWLISLHTDEDAIVLDATAGSGTTGQAVLALNQEDGGNRRFVLIQLEEETPRGSPARAAGFSHVHEITADRVRRVIKGVATAKDEALQKGLDGTFTFVEVGNAMQLESLLRGSKLPSFEDLAGYVFYTATGEDFDERAIKKKTRFIGTSARYDVYLFYEPDLDYLKNTALTLDMARELPKGSGKRRLVFAPTKYLDAIHLEEHRIDFCQLPFEIYKTIKPKKA